jgi:hypothetical protein
VRWLLPDQRRGELHLDVIAELPQLLGRARVLEQNAVELEGVELAGAVAIDSLADAGDEVAQLGFVVFGDQRAALINGLQITLIDGIGSAVTAAHDTADALRSTATDYDAADGNAAERLRKTR